MLSLHWPRLKRSPSDIDRWSRMLTISAGVLFLAFLVIGTAVWISQNGLVASGKAVTHSRAILSDLEKMTSEMTEAKEADGLCRNENDDEACFRAARSRADFRAVLRDLSEEANKRDRILRERITRIQVQVAQALPIDMHVPDPESVAIIRSAVQDMKTLERFRMSELLDQFNRLASKAQETTLAMLVFGAVLLVAGQFALWKGIGKQRSSQRQLERLNSDLAVARREALALSEAKGRFLADMSHEIRTPLNGIVGMSSMLELDGLPPEIADIVRTIRSSSDVLLRVVDDVLDLSKIEANRVVLHSEPLELHGLIWDVTNLYRGLAEEGANALKLDIPDQECWVLGDAVRLKQVFGNLVSNAVKFCRGGEVCVTVTHTPDNTHVIRVSDSGIGIAHDRLQSIFDEFVQAHLSVSNEHGGTGLGLAIAKKLVTRMGGDVKVRSQLGIGSEFEVSLPLPLSSAPASQNTPNPIDVSGLRILLAEDNEVNILVATSILERAGCIVDVARDGIDTTEKAIKGRYDVVLMDLRMPLREGTEATRLIVASYRNRPGRPRIVAMTANAAAEDREACLLSGMDAFIAKPFTYEHLVQSLQLLSPVRI